MGQQDGKMYARTGAGGASRDDSDMTPQERLALEDVLATSIAQMERGEVLDMDDVLAQAE